MRDATISIKFVEACLLYHHIIFRRRHFAGVEQKSFACAANRDPCPLAQLCDVVRVSVLFRVSFLSCDLINERMRWRCTLLAS